MKILLDPLFTNHPSNCASTAKFMGILRMLLEDENNFVYFLMQDFREKDHAWWEEVTFGLDTSRVKLIHYFQHKDRYRPYRRIPETVEKAVAYYGDYWDWDLMITNKASLVPFYKQMGMFQSTKRGKEGHGKRVVVLEDFPQLSYKKAAAVPHIDAQDLQTLIGYATSDGVCLAGFWQRDEIVNLSKRYLSPALTMQLSEVIAQTLPKPTKETFVKSPEFVNDSSKTFTMAFAGRLVSGFGFDEMFKIMHDNWVLKQGDTGVNCVLSTQSKGTNPHLTIPDFIDLRFTGPKDFHQLMTNEVHVGMFFSYEEDWSSSLAEPMILGVPYIIKRYKWVLESFGPDYPFYVDSMMEAYAFVKMFHDDYPAMYAKFEHWTKNHFQPLMAARQSSTEFVQSIAHDLKTVKPTSYNMTEMFMTELAEQVAAKGSASLGELGQGLSEKGLLSHFGEKLASDEWEIPTPFTSNRYKIRNALLCAGASDGGLETGRLTIKGLANLPE